MALCAAQEEVGVRGATVTAQVIKPDIAIVFEGCPADDTCVESYMVQTAIKRGPMLRHIDARMITNPIIKDMHWIWQKSLVFRFRMQFAVLVQPMVQLYI